MKKEIKKFLEFNGKTIFFVDVNGTNWIAIKPICDVLNVNYNRQFQNLKEDGILSRLFANQQIVAADNRIREMVCLPERYIYGWIFSLNSKSEELELYKLKCHDVLYDHFHGTITQRKDFLAQRNDVDARLKEINEQLREENELVKERNRLINEKKVINSNLKNLDASLFKVPDLFSDLN